MVAGVIIEQFAQERRLDHREVVLMCFSAQVIEFTFAQQPSYRFPLFLPPFLPPFFMIVPLMIMSIDSL